VRKRNRKGTEVAEGERQKAQGEKENRSLLLLLLLLSLFNPLCVLCASAVSNFSHCVHLGVTLPLCSSLVWHEWNLGFIGSTRIFA
jgi:hypothetical protein